MLWTTSSSNSTSVRQNSSAFLAGSLNVNLNSFQWYCRGTLVRMSLSGTLARTSKPWWSMESITASFKVQAKNKGEGQLYRTTAKVIIWTTRKKPSQVRNYKSMLCNIAICEDIRESLTLANALKYSKQKNISALLLESLRLIPSISFAENGTGKENI